MTVQDIASIASAMSLSTESAGGVGRRSVTHKSTPMRCLEVAIVLDWHSGLGRCAAVFGFPDSWRCSGEGSLFYRAGLHIYVLLNTGP